MWRRDGGLRLSRARGIDSVTSHCHDMRHARRRSLLRSPNSPTWPGSRRAPSATTSPRGCCPPSASRDPAAKYGAGHLARLRLIRRLQAEHLPLAEIRRRLEGLDDETIRELADAASRRRRPTPRSSTCGPSWAGRGRVAATLRTGARPIPRPGTGHARRSRRPARVPGPAARHGAGGRAVRHADAVADAARPRRRRPSARRRRPRRPDAAGERSQWERIVLAPDVELHIRRPLTRSQNKQVDRLVTIARELLEEDRS